MATYKIRAEMDLQMLISEVKEVIQALNEFANNLEQIQIKYAKQAESEDDYE